MDTIKLGNLPSQVILILMLLVVSGTAFAQPAANSPHTEDIWVVETQGKVEVLRADTTVWTNAQVGHWLHPHDRVRTAANSRLALRWSNQSVVSFGPTTELEVLPPNSPDQQAGLSLARGIISFFHRDQPGRIRVITRGAVAGIEGTEFVLSVDEADRTTLSVVDGKVKFGNPNGTLSLTNGEQAVAENGRAPMRTAGFISNNLLQWCFYYPAVIALDELQFTDAEKSNLASSLAAYRSGDLLKALAQYSEGRMTVSDTEKVYHAALLLSVGNVAKAESLISEISATSERSQRLAMALRQMIATVKHQPGISTTEPKLASEAMAASYYEQSRGVKDVSLLKALRLAKQVTTNSPNFGFAWERLAELEFSFGQTKETLKALDKSLALSPQNAQALALKGFVFSSQNRPLAARECFDRAIAVDAALGNAWLGRGLARIRLGDTKGGREDLLMAAALEPQRAELRSYLGKAYTAAGDDAQATKELALAKKLDPNDPTAWLYSALLNQQNNQINDAIRDLEKSQALNGNRSVYRSGLMLDQDQAVRSANLASMYRDAGMTDVSVREAGRAVNSDYANYSAHNFLANSYYGLLQPGQNNSRYEPVVDSEYLIANLLAPAGAGVFSPIVGMQQRFTPFERNHLGAISSTEYLGRGAWTESAMQYGTFDNFSYGVEGNYHSDPGQHPNSDVVDKSVNLMLKLALTPQDIFFAGVEERRREAGDLNQYYNPYAMGCPDARFTERQDPNLTLGYHHEWRPGVHTLLMVKRNEDDFSLTGTLPAILAVRFANLTANPYELVSVSGGYLMHDFYQNKLTLYSTEVQQIFEQGDHTTIAGVRYQYGSLATTNFESHPSAGIYWNDPSAQQEVNNTLKRFSVYGYHSWQIANPLQLIGGLSYDWMDYPVNIFSPPVSSQSATKGQLSPKAGLIWTPAPDTAVRLAYTRSLGGQNFDQSLRLEPTQVAGFQQTFRTLIGDPSVPPNGAAKDETYALSLERKFSTGTYLALTGEILKSKISQAVGVFDGLPDLYDWAIPSVLNQNLDYREESLQFTVNQLLGRDWVLGAQYRLSQSKLDEDFPEVSQNYGHLYHNPTYPFVPQQKLEATLNQVSLYAIYNLPCGFFSEVDARWFGQNNRGYSPAEPGDDFWQFDASVGYRFWHRAAQVTVGVLNLGDHNYSLNPLNAYNEMARARTFVARFQFNF